MGSPLHPLVYPFIHRLTVT